MSEENSSNKPGVLVGAKADATKLEELLKKVTPLPWHQPTGSGDVAMLTNEYGVVIVRCMQRGSETPYPELNAALIAHAVNTLPKLVDALEDAKQALAHALYRLKDDQEFSTSIALKWAEAKAQRVLAEANNPKSNPSS